MPIISSESTHQTVITTFEINPENCRDLLDKLEDAYETFLRTQPGFVAAGLHVNDARTRIASYSQWKTREDFLAMLRSDQMQAYSREFTRLCRSFEPVMYDVVHSIG